MHYPLMDITDRIPEPPKWWLDGIPRYCEYHPGMFAFYKTNLLVRICCQHCHRVFDTAVRTRATLEQHVLDPFLGYPLDAGTGQVLDDAHDDPPFHLGSDGYVCVGNSMTADWVAILEAWEKDGQKLRRRSDIEGPSPDSPI